MPIEIRELVIKVKVEELAKKTDKTLHMDTIKAFVEATCKREVRTQLNKLKER